MEIRTSTPSDRGVGDVVDRRRPDAYPQAGSDPNASANAPKQAPATPYGRQDNPDGGR